MKQLEESLPSNRFLRVHKSYIVALDKINSVERQEIYIGDRVIPIGITYQEAFFKFLQQHIPDATFVEIDSIYGHDGFLVETEAITRHLSNWLKQ